MFKRGDLVWGKIKSFPWWPGMVINAEDCGRKKSKNKLWLFWFGDHKFSEIEIEKITDFKENYTSNTMKNSNKLFQKAVEEVLHVLASFHDLRFTDNASLLIWAKSGFPSLSSRPDDNQNSKLPNLVEEFLTNKLKVDEEESDDSDMDVDDILPDVRKSKISLEAVCISCCKRNVKVVAPHPLFEGSVCVQCKKGVFRAYKTPLGQLQDSCIVCGNGGNLVICANSICMRAYCQLCIEYMVSEEAYAKIVQDEDWLCYLCEVDSRKKCLIRRKNIHLLSSSSLPPAPDLKTSLNVLALNENGRRILQKANIKVLNYYVHPEYESASMCQFMDYSSHYKDFTSKQIAEISADLILGSFFIPDLPYDRKTYVSKFFLLFNRFLFRLDVTRLFKTNIFFIFLAEMQMLDENVLSRVLRFLMVRPVTVILGEKKFLVWSNLSSVVSNTNKGFKDKSLNDANAIEEKIMLPFVKKLQKYFVKEQ